MEPVVEDLIKMAREQGRRDERGRIIAWGLEDCPHWAGIMKRDCSLCWQALKDGEGE